MNKTEIINEKSWITRIKFAAAWILFLGFNLLILYFYPRNIYIDISFVLVVFFIFKLLGLRSINILLYGASYLVLGFVFSFFRNSILSQRLLDKISFYIPCFFILAFIGLIYEEKIEKKITFKKKKISYLWTFCVFSVLFIFLFVNFYLEAPSTRIALHITKQAISRFLSKEEYYRKKESAVIDGVKIKEEITISVKYPKKSAPIKEKIKISGWALEKNSKYGSGIDKIEFFLDGKPGEGKYLGNFSQNYDAKLETKEFIENLYLKLYDWLPSTSELNFWAINLEYGIMSYSEVASSIIDESGFMKRYLQKKDFLGKLFAGLLGRNWDGSLLDRLGKDLKREDVLYIFINSQEFIKISEDYYKNITLRNDNLDIIRKDIGEKYGRQFSLSGFSFEFDSTAFPNGEHTLYIYAHSPVFGWDYLTVNLIIDNN